ncbi:17308_t:CDS:2 [Funneliformis caledonium]|uniref:17308_t:CDS:1 n=1 Tax=Funneliformis caledonium TaxID=1117310 RepID=A0A9N9C743_9GLOM|nr:17308_t:CDS:2 [Funneliformis caledonium]
MVVAFLISGQLTLEYLVVKSETSNKSLMDYCLKILDVSANHNINKIVLEISNLYEDQEIPKLDTDALLSKKRSRIQQEESAKENIFQENLLNSVAKASNTFSKMLNKTHDLLSIDESTSLSERLTLDDENDHISTKAYEYLMLFDQIIEYPLEEEATKTDLINLENNDIKKDKVICELEKTIHDLSKVATKFRYLSNTLPLPILKYDQSQYPDIHIIKSISSHIDSIIKLEGILENTSERSWTAHVLAYFFFITFNFLDFIQYFLCERTISIKSDLQDTDYKADRVTEFFKWLNQIPIFLLEVSGDSNNLDPDKCNTDRQKLMKEGVFALNKFMTRTSLPT